MKTSILILTTIFFLLTSCGEREKHDVSNNKNKTCVEILYFHGNMRCKSCYAMEKGISQLLDEQFKDEVKDGKIVFKTIDITSPEGEQIADNYGVTWSSLFLNNWVEGKEERNDLTRMGMKTAAKDPEKFKNIVADQIIAYLK